MRFVPSIFTVDIPKLLDIICLPSVEQKKVQNALGVKIEAHEGEQSIQDLVVRLEPCIPYTLTCNGMVQEAHHDEEKHGA